MDAPGPRLFNLRVTSTLIIAAAGILVAAILAPTNYLSWIANSARRALSSNYSGTARSISSFANMTSDAKTPVYFLSHGGPNLMYDVDHPAYAELQKIGKEITQTVKPKAVVVFSAHWEGESDVIEVNTSEATDLVYDYYGFPSHYYTEKYPNKGSKPVADKVIGLLNSAGIKTQATRRGLDHGVFVVFKVAFDPETNPLNVPIVQVSLFANESPRAHYDLGRAVASLRGENIAIIGTGMAVHNLRDFRVAMGKPAPLSYVYSFDAALKEAAEEKPAGREDAMANLLKRPDARRAHPTMEHLMPVFVAAGAADSEQGKQLWTMPQWSMSWAQYRFGEVTAGDGSRI